VLPGGGRVVQDVGDLLVVQHGRPAGYDAVVGGVTDLDGPLQAPEDDVDDVLTSAFDGDEFGEVAGQRREGALDAQAGRLVAGHAVGVEDRFAGGRIHFTDGGAFGGGAFLGEDEGN